MHIDNESSTLQQLAEQQRLLAERLEQLAEQQRLLAEWQQQLAGWLDHLEEKMNGLVLGIEDRMQSRGGLEGRVGEIEVLYQQAFDAIIVELRSAIETVQRQTPSQPRGRDRRSGAGSINGRK